MKKFETRDDIKLALTSFFSSKPELFYRQGIEKLVKRWEIIMNNNGHYILD
jgi:hypothetical protein